MILAKGMGKSGINPLLYVTTNASYSSLFKFIDPLKNDKLSELSPSDLQHFLVLLDEYYLEYRHILGFENDVRVKTSISFEGVDHDELDKVALNILGETGWKTFIDSANDNSSYIEYVDITSDSWKNIKEFLHHFNGRINSSSYGENGIYVGRESLEDSIEYWKRFIKFLITYENIIFRFSNGEFINCRSHISQRYHVKPFAPTLIKLESRYKDLSELHDFLVIINRYIESGTPIRISDLFHSDYSDSSRVDLIKFLYPNNTLDPVIVQNNINMFVKMMLAITSDIDFDVVENRYDKITQGVDISESSEPFSLSVYNYIDIGQALEFADLVFDNNFDKVYFLRQYFKSFELPKNNKNLQRARRFTEEIDYDNL